MTAQTLTLTTFLEARIAEDEALADRVALDYPGAGDWESLKDRVLAECKAKRAIVEWHESTVREGEKFCAECGPPETEVYLYAPGTMHYPCPTLRALASVYADHGDYRAEWAL